MLIYIRKIARYHDEARSETKDEFRFRRTDCSIGRKLIMRSSAENPKELHKFLIDAGAQLPSSAEDLNLLLQELIKAKPRKEFRSTKKAGWRDRNRTFIRPIGALGRKRMAFAGVSPSRISTGFPLPTQAGTLAGWRSKVAAIASESSIAMLTVSAAFAAPLLHLSGVPSFGLCIHAPSRNGKTAVTLAAGSVIGIGAADQIVTWNQTAKALEQTCACSNDCLLPIDDLSGRSGSARALYEDFRGLAHLVASGYGTSRHSSHEATARVGHDRWRLLALTSRETSVASLARSLGHEREIGEAVRLIDVPAFSSGYSNIFDLATHQISVSEAEARLADLYNACRRHHGHVFDTYVSKLAKDHQLKSKIKSLIGDFVESNVTTDDELVIRDIAKKFGLIYAGGRIATELGLTGWNHDELLKAISGTFLGAKSHLPDPSDTLKRGLRALRQGLKYLPKKKGVDQKSFGTIIGYKLSSTDKTTFVILKHKFNELFETREQAERVTQFLMERDYLRLRSIKQGSRPEPKEQIIWPDQKRRRSYQINLPRRDWSGALSLNAPVHGPTE